MDHPKRLPTLERRRQLAEAALRILASRGASRLTAAALAAEVGITDGAIFRHYKSKDEIVDAAIDLFEATLESTFPDAAGEPLVRLREFVEARLALVRRRPELMRLAFNDRLAEAAGEDRSTRIAAVVGRSAAFVHACIVESQARGEVANDVSPTVLVWMVIGVIRGAARGGPQNVPGEQDLQQSPPDVVWSQLERLLRSTR